MLYMKTRVTFRVAAELADELRELPNQTQFVETALRNALGQRCTACDGTGRVRRSSLSVTSFRAARLPALDRSAAIELQRLVRTARALAATRLDLARAGSRRGLDFVVARRGSILLRGTLREGAWPT
jgi:hypothetical protein